MIGAAGLSATGGTWRPSALLSGPAIVEPRDPAGGQISPELVLVDPELAARARAALPDHPWPAPVRIEPATRRRRLSIPVAPTFSILSLAAFAAILGVSFLPTRDQPTFAAEGRRIPTAASSATAKAQGAARRPAGKPRRLGRPERGQFKPAPTFAWPPRAGAAYYQVALFRSGRRFFHARTRAARLTLPRSVRFKSGTYRWTVRPAIRSRKGIRLGHPIVDSRFRIGRT